MTLEAAAHDLLFREARTHNKWQDKPVTDEQIHELYELLKYRPDLGQLIARPVRLHPHAGRQGKAETRPLVRQPGQDHGGAA